MSDMNGKVALITGASSGIGRATSEAFAARGASVVLAARREEELAALTGEIVARGGKGKLRCRRREHFSRSGKDGGTHHRDIRTLGLCGQRCRLRRKSCKRHRSARGGLGQVLDTNLKGVFLCLKYEGRAMLDGGQGGAIVNVGSVNSFLGAAVIPAYVASKHGLIGLTSSVSADFAPRGIRVNILCPGFIDTPMHHRGRSLVGDAFYDNVLSQRVHLRRAGRPEEIARSIVFLCSDDASYITGTTLTPDGGFTLTI